MGHDSGLGEPQARMREENMERIRKVGGGEPAKEKQCSCDLGAVSIDPPQHDHHEDFCLTP